MAAPVAGAEKIPAVEPDAEGSRSRDALATSRSDVLLMSASAPQRAIGRKYFQFVRSKRLAPKKP
jgi:hypothetical protein